MRRHLAGGVITFGMLRAVLPNCPVPRNHVPPACLATYMHHFDDDEFDPDGEVDDSADDTQEGLIWQLLQLINPGDVELALQEFSAWREAQESGHAEDDLLEAVSQVIDWRSGFRVGADDTRALVQAIDELSARWNLTLDWDGDTDDDEFHAEQDVPSLMAVAYDRLAEFGYTLWSWETDDGTCAGWITQTLDCEPMRELATALEINLRLGSEVS